MTASELLDHDVELHFAYKIGRRGKKYLIRIGKTNAAIKPFYPGKKMTANFSAKELESAAEENKTILACSR